jgi:DNA replication protein DnaC
MEKGDRKIGTEWKKWIVAQRAKPFQESPSGSNWKSAVNLYPTPVGKLMRKGKNMLNEQTFDKLYTMKLTGMAEGFKEQLEQPSFRDLSFEERFGILVDRQWTWKENKRLKRLLRDAKLKLQASPEDIDFRTPRGIEKSVILSLTSCQWIRSHQNLLISGPTGVGKTFLACAFAQRACREGFRTLYLRVPQLFYQIALARADGSYGTLMKRLSKTHLLVLDDLGLAPLAETERRDLLEVIEERTGSTSTLITGQLPIDHWHDHIGDPTIADAIMDRLIHNAHRIQLKGGSMRKKQKLDEN